MCNVIDEQYTNEAPAMRMLTRRGSWGPAVGVVGRWGRGGLYKRLHFPKCTMHAVLCSDTFCLLQPHTLCTPPLLFFLFHSFLSSQPWISPVPYSTPSLSFHSPSIHPPFLSFALSFLFFCSSSPVAYLYLFFFILPALPPRFPFSPFPLFPSLADSLSLFPSLPFSSLFLFSKCFVWEGPRPFREMFYVLQTACGRNCSTEGISPSSAELFSLSPFCSLFLSLFLLPLCTLSQWSMSS